MKKLKIGLLISHKASDNFSYQLVNWAKKQANLEITDLIIWCRLECPGVVLVAFGNYTSQKSNPTDLYFYR